MRDLIFLVRIVLTAIVFGFVGNNHLNVSFWSQSAALKERNLIFHASLIHVLPSTNVIQGIGYDSSAFKEFIGINFFCFFTDFIETSMNVALKTRVQLQESSTCSSRFGFFDVFVSKQKLPGQI